MIQALSPEMTPFSRANPWPVELSAKANGVYQALAGPVLEAVDGLLDSLEGFPPDPTRFMTLVNMHLRHIAVSTTDPHLKVTMNATYDLFHHRCTLVHLSVG